MSFREWLWILGWFAGLVLILSLSSGDGESSPNRFQPGLFLTLLFIWSLPYALIAEIAARRRKARMALEKPVERPDELQE
jgi:hypothetical protein